MGSSPTGGTMVKVKTTKSFMETVEDQITTFPKKLQKLLDAMHDTRVTQQERKANPIPDDDKELNVITNAIAYAMQTYGKDEDDQPLVIEISDKKLQKYKAVAERVLFDLREYRDEPNAFETTDFSTQGFGL